MGRYRGYIGMCKLGMCKLAYDTLLLDSVYHMTLKLLKNHIFGVKHPDFSLFYATLQCIMDVITEHY